jgi:hypothetical protein
VVASLQRSDDRGVLGEIRRVSSERCSAGLPSDRDDGARPDISGTGPTVRFLILTGGSDGEGFGPRWSASRGECG